MTNIIIGGIAIALIVLPRIYKYIPFGKLWSKISGGKNEIKAKDGFDIVVAVDKFEDLRRYLEVGELDEALEKLDVVFPLLNERR